MSEPKHTARLQPITGLMTPEATGHSVDLERDCGCRVLAGPILVYCPLHGAAPDLLAIAQEIVAWERDPDHYGGDLADLAHRALSIIAKATSREVTP